MTFQTRIAETYILLLIFRNKIIFFSLYLALFSISCNENQTFDATIGLTTDSWLKLFVLNKGPKLS